MFWHKAEVQLITNQMKLLHVIGVVNYSENCTWRQTELVFSVFHLNIQMNQKKPLIHYSIFISNRTLRAIQQITKEINATEIAEQFLL